jgi:tRNA(Ile2)-agmatinylcytidine synthase
MTVVGIDDTDSRERGLCTTYVAAVAAEAVVDAGGTVRDRLLVRLNPAIEHKTRGNAALALHVDLAPDRALALVRDVVDEWALADDPAAQPGVVVAPGAPDDVPDAVAAFAREAVRGRHALADALALADRVGYDHVGWAGGRGRIGALAAVGADRAFDDWTYERLSYRQFDRCGTPRDVDVDSAFAAAADPAVWDTVDRVTGEAVCVPRAPGPVLHGIRGDDPTAVERVAAAIESEPVARAATVRTNQGTDAHVRPGTVTAFADLRDGRAYRVDGTVAAPPTTRRGGHVAVPLRDPDGRRLGCLAFAPTGRFRDRVRALRAGDEVTAVGEYDVPDGAGDDADADADGDARAVPGALKLEKLCVRALVRTEATTPTCPACGRSMESTGRGQGYRCRNCETDAPGKLLRPVARDLDRGWYEVPPSARRHVAKPLVRGGFDAPTHPEE